MSARPDHCHEEIDNIVDGSTEPCGIKPVGWRIDPEENKPYPVCMLHHRWPYADGWVQANAQVANLRARLLAANDRLAEAEARVRRVHEVLAALEQGDGQHVPGCGGEPDCSACVALDLRAALAPTTDTPEDR